MIPDKISKANWNGETTHDKYNRYYVRNNYNYSGYFTTKVSALNQINTKSKFNFIC